MVVMRHGVGALDVGKGAAEEGHVCANNVPCGSENCGIDVDVCVDLG